MSKKTPISIMKVAISNERIMDAIESRIRGLEKADIYDERKIGYMSSRTQRQIQDIYRNKKLPPQVMLNIPNTLNDNANKYDKGVVYRIRDNMKKGWVQTAAEIAHTNQKSLPGAKMTRGEWEKTLGSLNDNSYEYTKLFGTDGITPSGIEEHGWGNGRLVESKYKQIPSSDNDRYLREARDAMGIKDTSAIPTEATAPQHMETVKKTRKASKALNYVRSHPYISSSIAIGGLGGLGYLGYRAFKHNKNEKNASTAIEDIGTTVPPASKNKPTQPKTYIRMSRIEGSSNIKSVGYSKRNKELAVRFKNGNKRYFYSGVPYAMYEEMLNAPSKGKFLNQNIKGKYPYQREYAYSDGGYMAKAAGIPMFIKMAAVMFAKNYDVYTQIA